MKLPMSLLGWIAVLSAIAVMLAVEIAFYRSDKNCEAPALSTPIEIQKNWPPTNDEEFLRRCPEGTDQETALRVPKTA